jgi:hypothetical protein
MCRVAANTLNKQLQTANKGGPLAWGLDSGLTTPHGKEQHLMKCCTQPWTWADSVERPKQQKINMTFGTWNVYKSGSLRQLAKYKIDVVGVQVTWDKGSTQP